MPSQELIDTMLGNQPPREPAAPPPPWLARLTEAMSQPAGAVSEEESYRQMFDRNPALAGQMRMFGTSPITATPEENGRAALGMLPVTGNVIAAQDAYNSFGDLRKASKAGDVHEQRKAMAQMLMGVLGAMSPLPWGKTAGMMAKEAKDTAYAFPAWHGSPHDFDEFKLDKIGTGEGAQVYGHGLYFAENPATARWYQEQLSDKTLTFDGKPMTTPEDWWQLKPKLEQENWRLGKLLDEFDSLRRQGFTQEAALVDRRNWHRGDEAMQSALNEFEKRANLKPQGRLYHTEIDAEPHQLLDWDKPLSQQSPEVQKAVEALPHKPRPMYNSSGEEIPLTERSGEHYYRGLAETLGRPFDKATGRSEWANHEGAAQALREAGIPGIRYADQGSRGQGAGTSNYVIFDDKIVKIKGKE